MPKELEVKVVINKELGGALRWAREDGEGKWAKNREHAKPITSEPPSVAEGTVRSSLMETILPRPSVREFRSIEEG
jgi:hypothetical protein